MRKSFLLIFYLILLDGIVSAQEVAQVTGMGNSCTEARNDALRNAVNTANGSMIFSNTEIKNDSLISDEINMLTSGNILKYEEIKPCSFKDGRWEIQLKVTVSKTELKKYIEGRGKSVAISGELLKQKIEQEISSKTSELNLIQALILQLETISKNPFDYEISIGEVTIRDGKYCDLPAEINIKTNINLYNAFLKLTRELDEISVSSMDQTFRTKTMKEPNHQIQINSNIYVLRNKESVDYIRQFYTRLLSKINNYVVVDGCFNEMYLQENRKITNLSEGVYYFPEAGFISKMIYGKYTTTIEEIGSLDRINIFSKDKELEYRTNRGLNGELNLMKYSETNPLEFKELKTNFLSSIHELSTENRSGSVDMVYKIFYTKDGLNKSIMEKLQVSSMNYSKSLTSRMNSVKLNPSKLCGNFIQSSDSIIFKCSWTTYTKRFVYKEGMSSSYNSYFNSNRLPYGTYKLTVKDKNLNDIEYKDVIISGYRVRGPMNALYSAILPGWGLRRVSYNKQKGLDRFAMVAIPMAFSYLSRAASNANYQKYINATQQTEIDKFYNAANNWNKMAYISAGIGVSLYVYDIVSTFNLGVKNLRNVRSIREKIKKSEYKIQIQPLT
jgi:hypothetical protein